MRSPAEKWNTEHVLGPVGSLECQSLELETLQVCLYSQGIWKGKSENKMTNDFIFYSRLVFQFLSLWGFSWSDSKGWDCHVKVTLDGGLPARCVHVLLILLLCVSLQLLPIHTLRLGMEVDSFDGHHYISSIAPGGPLHTLNLLQPEDELLEVKFFEGGGKKDTGQEYLSCRKMCPCQKSTELYHQCQYNVSY